MTTEITCHSNDNPLDNSIYRILIEYMFNGMAYCKMLYQEGQPVDFIYLYVNPAFERLTGLKQVLGKPVSAILPGILETEPQLFEIYGRVALGGPPEKFEIYISSLEIWFSVFVYSPKSEHFIAIFEIITERKQAEVALKKNISLLQATLEATHEGILVVDLMGSWTLCNQRFVELWQIPADICEKKDDAVALEHVLNQLVDPFGFLKQVQALYAAPEANSFDILQFKDGKQVERYSFPQRVDGNIVGRVWSFRDITLYQEALQALASESQMNSALLRNASDGIHILDVNGRLLEVSDSFCTMLGYSRDEILGKDITCWDALLSECEIAHRLDTQFKHQSRYQFETRHRRKEGTVIDVEISCFPVHVNQQSILFCSSRDISERKQKEEQIKLAASVFSHAREGIMITSSEASIIDVNEAFSHITGYSRHEVLGRNPRILRSGFHKKEYFQTLWKNLLDQGYWSGEIWNQHKNGDIIAAMLTISAVFDQQGQVQHYIALYYDITKLKDHERQLEYLAHYDALTGLPNRVLLLDRLQHSMALALRNQQLLAVVYLDLDGFKNVNDDYGHAAGDHVLTVVSTRMKQTLREADSLGRLSGDEFVAVLQNCGRIEETTDILIRLLNAASQSINFNQTILQVSASLGVTFYPQSEPINADQLLSQADHAMYRAKQTGKNKYQFFVQE